MPAGAGYRSASCPRNAQSKSPLVERLSSSATQSVQCSYARVVKTSHVHLEPSVANVRGAGNPQVSAGRASGGTVKRKEFAYPCRASSLPMHFSISSPRGNGSVQEEKGVTTRSRACEAGGGSSQQSEGGVKPRASVDYSSLPSPSAVLVESRTGLT